MRTERPGRPDPDLRVMDPAVLRLEALARLVGAPTSGGELEDLLAAFADGVRAGFGLEVAVHVLEDELDAYVVRAASGPALADELGARTAAAEVDRVLDGAREAIPDVFV